MSIKLLNLLTDKKQPIWMLASKVGTTPHNLARIVKPLSAAKLVKTARGNSGGLTRIDGDITLKMLLDVFYPDPKDDLLTSNETSDKLNLLYLSFLEAVSIYRNGKALQALEPLQPLPVDQKLIDELPEEESEEYAEEIPEEIKEPQTEEVDWGNGW